MIKQRLIGAALIACGIASALIDGDITVLVVVAPVGAYLMASKKNWIVEDADGADDD